MEFMFLVQLAHLIEPVDTRMKAVEDYIKVNSSDLLQLVALSVHLLEIDSQFFKHRDYFLTKSPENN